jgi:hypothetical protein
MLMLSCMTTAKSPEMNFQNREAAANIFWVLIARLCALPPRLIGGERLFVRIECSMNDGVSLGGDRRMTA